MSRKMSRKMAGNAVPALNTRQRIIEAALSVAARQGFAKATTAQIARKAGVSEGIIYHYFNSKYDLCASMIKEKAERFRFQLMEEIKGFASPLEKLKRLIDFHFEYFTGKGNIFQAIYGKSGDTTVMMGHILKIAIIPYARIVEGIVKEGIKRGELRRMDPCVAASSLLGMMQISIIRLHFRLGKFSAKDARHQIKDIFLNGLAKRI